jgi:hypothetical protein
MGPAKEVILNSLQDRYSRIWHKSVMEAELKSLALETIQSVWDDLKVQPHDDLSDLAMTWRDWKSESERESSPFDPPRVSWAWLGVQVLEELAREVHATDPRIINLHSKQTEARPE